MSQFYVAALAITGSGPTCNPLCRFGCKDRHGACNRCPPHADSTCKMCTGGYKLNNMCVSTCDPPLYLHTETNECFSCHSQCAGGCFGSVSYSSKFGF